MAKQSSVTTVTQSDADLTAQYNGRDLSIESLKLHENPTGHCAIQASKLFALTHMLTGLGYEHFDSSDDDIKQNFSWLVRDLAHEVWVLADLAHKERRQGQTKDGAAHG
jgi:hypothetical protein